MKQILSIVLAMMVSARVNAQPQEILTLETCYSLAEKNYPLIMQRELIEKTKEFSVSNASKGFLPSVVLNAQQSHQSDVTQIPAELGLGSNVLGLSKNQYKIYADINAPIYEGGVIRAQKQMHDINAKIEERQLDVELYKLKDRVNQLFFGILLLDGQLEQNRLLIHDIELGLKKTNALISNGTALKSSADVLQADLLKAKQTSIELMATRTAYVDMLALLTGLSLNGNTVIEKPAPITPAMEISRPELGLYKYQTEAIDIQSKMLRSRNRPKLSAFLQAGYGRPALNMLSNQPDAYYIGGIRLNWIISGFYTFKKEKDLLEVNRKTINTQKETFLFNTAYSLKQQNGEEQKLRQLIATDDEIITLRDKVKRTASVQLEGGIITTNDYLREVSAEDQARQLKILHEIQLLLAQYTQQTTTGI